MNNPLISIIISDNVELDNDFMIYRQNIKLNNYKNIKDEK